MSAETLKKQMADFEAGKAKKVSISAADLQGDGAADGTASGPTTGTVQADVPEVAKADPMFKAGATADLHAGMATSFLKEKVDISDDDRRAFLDAIVTGGRYEREFSVFGGKIRGVFRCRSIAESDGIIAWLSYCVNSRKADANIEYLTMMRDAMLATQVKSLRGAISEDFEELPTPYAPTRKVVIKKDDEGRAYQDVEVTEPGWLAAAADWGKRPEALVTAIHNELQLFEKRYWTMVSESKNQNFWNPAAST